MKKRRQKKAPTAKPRAKSNFVWVEAKPPQTILQALRKLQRLRVEELELHAKTALRKMEEASEALALFALVKEGRETVLESVASEEKVLRARLQTLRKQERKAKILWAKWKKDKPQKRFQNLMALIMEAEKEAPKKDPQDLPAPKFFAQFPPAREVASVLSRNLDKDEKTQALLTARENLGKAVSIFEPHAQNYLKAWNAWEKALEDARRAGVRVVFKEEPQTPFSETLQTFATELQKDASEPQTVATQTRPSGKTKGRNANATQTQTNAKK